MQVVEVVLYAEQLYDIVPWYPQPTLTMYVSSDNQRLVAEATLQVMLMPCLETNPQITSCREKPCCKGFCGYL